MTFRSIARDVRDGLGSLSRGKSRSSVNEVREPPIVIQDSPWANLPPDLLRDIIKRLEASESEWPARKHVVACSSVCRSWREMCLEVVTTPEFSGKLTFPVSLKQPGSRDGAIECFIKRDKSKLTYSLFLCLMPEIDHDNGKFLLSAKRTRRTTCTEYVISMDADNISRSSSSYIGKLRSNFSGTKYIIYDTQPPCNSKNVVPNVSQNISQVTYKTNLLGNPVRRQMNVIMHSIPMSCLVPGGHVPGQAEHEEGKDRPLVLRTFSSLWDEQLQYFQLIAAATPAPSTWQTWTIGGLTTYQYCHKIILQFCKIDKDMFTMNYRYPLSAFQAFAICLTWFDKKIGL